jgi:hypothetical protein
VFDKYICRIIKKEEPTLQDLFLLIIHVVILCVLIFCPFYLLYYELIHPNPLNLSGLDVGSDLTFAFAITILDIVIIFDKSKYIKIAECPAKKQ